MSIKLYIEPYGANKWTEEILRYIPHVAVTIEECDFVISSKIPYGCINSSLIQEALSSYINQVKKVIVFLLSDYNEPFDVPKSVLFFRSGMYKSQQKSNEYLIPYIWVQSELNGQPPFTPLHKRTIHPLVGFCGSIVSHPSRIQQINELKKRS